MSTLLLVRHGQASFFGDDYDRLSPHGETQSQRLGDYLARTRQRVDRVYVGPLRRHHQTAAAAAASYRAAGQAWPTHEVLEELAEHQAPAVMKSVLAIEEASGNGGLNIVAAEDAGQRQAQVREYFTRWEVVTRRWISGEYPELSHEPWPVARARATQALAVMTAEAGGGETRLAFSSGGLICMILGELLDLSDDRVFDLSLTFGNAAMAEIRFSKARRSLVGFNLRPHLELDSLETMV